MPTSSAHSIVGSHAVKVSGGGKSLSVLATPTDDRTDASYQLSKDARDTLARVLAEDLETPERNGA